MVVAQEEAMAKRSWLRLGIGIMVAPTLPAVIAYLVFAAPGSRQTIAEMALVFAAICYSMTLLLGVPAYFLLRRRGKESLKSYLVAGAVSSAGSSLVFFSFCFFIVNSDPILMSLAIYLTIIAGLVPFTAGLGASVSGIFWVISIRPRSGEKE
jgi:hypothetical protein